MTRPHAAGQPPPSAPSSRRMLEALLGVPFTGGNRVDVLRNGDATFPAMLEAITASTRSVDLLWYLWGSGSVTRDFTGALVERARAGVRVRIMLDALGSKGIDDAQVAGLRRAGAQVLFYRPLTSWRVTAANRRIHQRVLLCDEQVAFTGGTGIDDGWAGDGTAPDEWRDTSYRVEGPAVDGLRAAFVSRWMQAPHALVTDQDRFPPPAVAGTAEVQVLRPPSQEGWNDMVTAVIALLHGARHRVRIATPYARLPVRVLELLTATSRRGVQVQLLLPGPHVDHPLGRLQGDHQHGRMLDAGVEIWCYQPAMLHTKMLTVDGHLAMVGTGNFDTRSFALNAQLQLVISDPATVTVLDGHYDEDLTRSTRATLQEWHQRGPGRRLLQSAVFVAARPMRGLGSASLTGRRP